MPLLQATQAPPAAPESPAAPSPAQGAPVGVKVGGTTISVDPSRMTAADLAALKTRRSELSDQLTSATRRRDDLVRKIERADDSQAEGMQPQLAVLNNRIVELEQAISLNGQMLAAAPLSLATETARRPAERYGPFTSGQLTAISIVGTVTVLMPLALAAARAMMVRARHPKPSPQILESTARLERMEQAIDAVAVEVERISEGQRFVTQLMASREKEALPEGR
ncbi:MAG: hypothetical protein IBJ03_09285 [Gemmatimonadaceae bacterium]|nr:hypothetical protein [Gemmatimonadaceae bacterium]